VEVQAAPEARNTPPSGEAASVSRGEPAVVKISAGVERPRVIGAPDIVPGRQARAEELPRAPRATTSAAVPAAAGVVPQETAGDIEPVSIPPLELHPLPEPPPIDIEAVTTEPIELESIDIPAIAQ
jgi:hypothetical protein